MLSYANYEICNIYAVFRAAIHGNKYASFNRTWKKIENWKIQVEKIIHFWCISTSKIGISYGTRS